MEVSELASEMLDYLNSTMRYVAFEEWCIERGWTQDEIDEAVQELELG